MQLSIALCACTGASGGALGLQTLVWPVNQQVTKELFVCTTAKLPHPSTAYADRLFQVPSNAETRTWTWPDILQYQ